MRISGIHLIAFLSACFGVTLVVGPATAADPAWVEVRSPHFRVISDGSEKEARQVARGFEQIRSVFAILLPNLKLDSGPPFLILAPTDEGSTKRLVPEYWKAIKGPKPVGLFHHGWEKTFAVVRLDDLRAEAQSQVASDAYNTIYHEYTHSLLHANFRGLPMWVDEGVAEFFGYTRFQRDKIYVGAPSKRATYMKGVSLLEIGKLLAMTGGSREMRDENTVQKFYRDSWALIHMLMVSPPKEEGKGLTAFLTKLDSGVEQKQAFSETIGDLKGIERQLDQYLSRLQLAAFTFPSPPQLDEDKFVSRRLTIAETAAELGSFEVWQREEDAARPRLEQALKENPKSALAHEAMGFLKFSEGKDSEAITEFEAAVQLDDKLYLSSYYLAMLSPKARSDSKGDQDAHRAALTRIAELAPNFAPVYVELANVEVRQGRLPVALALALKAEQLAPSRAGYHTFVGQILRAAGREAEAARLAKFVAERWILFDRDEAVLLWESLPASVKGDTSLVATPPTTGATRIVGRLDSVACNDKDKTMTFTIAGGAPLIVSTADGQSIGGFSDTLWYGSDHYSRCYHVEGLIATLEYKPASGGKGLPTLARFELRREPPIPAAQ
jgi:tetratricopeptide (TPR) repeat protein